MDSPWKHQLPIQRENVGDQPEFQHEKIALAD